VLAKTELITPASSGLPVLYPISSFLSFPNSIYSSKSKLSYVSAIPGLLLSYMVAKPLWWALEQVGVVGEDSLASSISSTFSSSSRSSTADTSWFGDYVFLKLVENAADVVIEKQRSKAIGLSDGLYTFDGFKKAFSDCLGLPESEEGKDCPLMSDLDMKVLLRHLERDKQAVVTDGEVGISSSILCL
jgi:charged multivesicular body protein 7